MAAQLKRYLTELGCELTIYFHDAKSWNGCTHLHEADIVMGDRSIGESPKYTLEQWLRSDILWPNLLTAQQYAHLQTTLDAIQRHPELAVRNDGTKALFSSLMEDAVLTPLFNYRYQVNAPPSVNGIFLNALG